MFGYIRPYKPELKVKDEKRYHNAYCALCNQLKCNYGMLGRLVLSYDITFLLLYLDSISAKKQVKRFSCPLSPFRKISIQISEDAMHYASFINYWLAIEKLHDDCIDDQSIVKKLLKRLLLSSRNFKADQIQYAKHLEMFKSALYDIYEQEKQVQGTMGFDQITNQFGQFFAMLFRTKDFMLQEQEQQDAVTSIFFQIGKWIYIIDAFDDLQEDIRKKRFNLLFSLHDNHCISKEKAFQQMVFIHRQITIKIEKILQKHPNVLTDACIINVVVFGMDAVFRQIIHKKYSEFERSDENVVNRSMEAMGSNN